MTPESLKHILDEYKISYMGIFGFCSSYRTWKFLPFVPGNYIKWFICYCSELKAYNSKDVSDAEGKRTRTSPSNTIAPSQSSWLTFGMTRVPSSSPQIPMGPVQVAGSLYTEHVHLQ